MSGIYAMLFLAFGVIKGMRNGNNTHSKTGTNLFDINEK